MDGRETDQDQGELRAPSVSLECVGTKCQAFIYSCIHRTPRSSSSFTHGNAYLCPSCIHSSTPRLHATCRNPPSICNHKEAARLDFACCLVHRWTRQVYFLGSNPSFVLCVPPPYCPYRPMWHFSSIPLPPIPPHPSAHCVLH